MVKKTTKRKGVNKINKLLNKNGIIPVIEK